jgi:hypothetical protein
MLDAASKNGGKNALHFRHYNNSLAECLAA